MPIAGRQGAALWEAHDVLDHHRCPECGEEFVTVGQVAIGAPADGYTPVFGAPVVIDHGRCGACHRDYQRTDDGPWGLQGSG